MVVLGVVRCLISEVHLPMYAGLSGQVAGLPFVARIVRCVQKCLMQTTRPRASPVGSAVIEVPILPSNPRYPQPPDHFFLGGQSRLEVPSQLILSGCTHGT